MTTFSFPHILIKNWHIHEWNVLLYDIYYITWLFVFQCYIVRERFCMITPWFCFESWKKMRPRGLAPMRKRRRERASSYVAGNPRQIIWAFYFEKVPLRNPREPGRASLATMMAAISTATSSSRDPRFFSETNNATACIRSAIPLKRNRNDFRRPAQTEKYLDAHFWRLHKRC